MGHRILLRIGVLLSVLPGCDSAGHGPLPLESTFELEAVEGETLPVLIAGIEGGWSLHILGGTVRCPDPQAPQPWESNHLSLTNPAGGVFEFRMEFEIDCEVEYPDRIRYTYPLSGEVVVGEVWREGPGGETYQSKRLPNHTVITATAAALGLVLPTENPFPDPMPVGVFRRKH